jgi:hypothetical protein
MPDMRPPVKGCRNSENLPLWPLTTALTRPVLRLFGADADVADADFQHTGVTTWLAS